MGTADSAAPLRLKTRHAATPKAAAGAYGAMQARTVPAAHVAAHAPVPDAPAATSTGFGLNWPLMIAATVLLGGGVVMGMAVGQAPRPQPAATVAVHPALPLPPAGQPRVSAGDPVASPVVEQAWRSLADLDRPALAPPPVPMLPRPTLPGPTATAPTEAETAQRPGADLATTPELPNPLPAEPAPATLAAAQPAATPKPAPKAAPAAERPVQLAAAPAPPPALSRAAGDMQGWRARAVAPPAAARPPFVAILIDDVGLDRAGTQRAMRLPGPVTLSFMSYAADAPAQAAAARAAGHEVMLHLPMEPIDLRRNNPGPNALMVAQDPAEVQRRLAWHLDRFGDYVGVNNHMGSRFTADAARMNLVLEELGRRQVFWLDSLTGPNSAGPALARKRGVDAVERDLFLDDERSPGIAHELAAMERIARSRGDVIAIGHPHGRTLAALEGWIAGARDKGFTLVPVSTVLLRRQQQER